MACATVSTGTKGSPPRASCDQRGPHPDHGRALPRARLSRRAGRVRDHGRRVRRHRAHQGEPGLVRSEEHTSELQSRPHLVCSLLLEKKKKKAYEIYYLQDKIEMTIRDCSL